MSFLKTTLLTAFLCVCLGTPAFAQDEDLPTDPVAVEAVPDVAVVEPVAEAAVEDVPVAEAAVEDVPVAPELEGDLESAEEVIGTVDLVIEAAKAGNYGLMLAGLLMLGIWVLRTYLWSALKKEWVPYVTIGSSTAVAFSGAMMSGASPLDALAVAAGGLFAGLSAIGIWELVGKKFLKKATEAPAAE